MTQKATNYIFSNLSEQSFTELAIEQFQYQANSNRIYAEFVKGLNININQINSIEKIPFIPVSFFKDHFIYCGEPIKSDVVFKSSGTTGMVQSHHFVKDIQLYCDSFNLGFEHFYGKITDYTLLALLPSYQERDGSSLIYMVDALIKSSQTAESGYYLYNHDDLFNQLIALKKQNRKVILIGVTYALLDFIEHFPIDFPELIVMETGGMKGKRKEMIREELHNILKMGFGVKHIHSEYGMTELLSQAYSKGNGLFDCPPWMKIMIRDTNDPLHFLSNGQSGGINVIDLANLHSCSFISTQDLGKIHPNGQFEVLGRFDNSDIRGCNLLVQ